MRVAIISIYLFIIVMQLFLLYFLNFGYEGTRFNVSDVSNTLTLLGINDHSIWNIN